MTVNLPDSTYEAAKRLAGDSPIEDIIAEALEGLRRKRMLEGINADFAALRSDPEASAAFDAERGEWEETLGDGIEPE